MNSKGSSFPLGGRSISPDGGPSLSMQQCHRKSATRSFTDEEMRISLRPASAPTLAPMCTEMPRMSPTGVGT